MMEHDSNSVRVGVSRHGLGVFSLKPLRVGECVGPIEGAVVDDPSYESNYCMELGDNGSIEPDAPFRFLNHCCRPNCCLVQFEVECEDGSPTRPELWIEVEADIAAGDELTIDYAWPARSAIPCSCGSPECRGWIVSAKDLKNVRNRKSRGPAR